MAIAANKKNWNWFSNESAGSQLPVRHRGLTENLPASSYFGPLSGFFMNMDWMFDNAFRNLRLPALAAMPGVLGREALFQPKVDIASSDDKYTITVETPGIEEKDIKLDISQDGLLTISGEKRHESEDKRKDYAYVECSYGAFQRTLSLPDDIDQEAVEARFNNGVLTIACPRTEKGRSQLRQILIGARGSRERISQDNMRAGVGQAGPKKAA